MLSDIGVVDYSLLWGATMLSNEVVRTLIIIAIALVLIVAIFFNMD